MRIPIRIEQALLGRNDDSTTIRVKRAPFQYERCAVAIGPLMVEESLGRLIRIILKIRSEVL